MSTLLLQGNRSIQVNKIRLYNDVKKLTAISPPRNYYNINSLNKASDYIIKEFKKLSCKVSVQKFNIENNEYKNVIASFNEKAKKRIIIGAHYDVCGNQPGADDNASGVAGLLELARMMDKYKPELKYRIDFAAYSLEEPPFFGTDMMGSAVHAQSLHKNKADIKIMICLEMIGYFTEEEKSQEYPTILMKPFYPDKGNFIGLVGRTGRSRQLKKLKKHMKEGINIDVETLSAPSFLPGIDFSDHRNFWKYGYNAVMVTDTSFYRNKNYHEPTDTIDTLDFDKMSEVVRGVYMILLKL